MSEDQESVNDGAAEDQTKEDGSLLEEPDKTLEQQAQEEGVDYTPEEEKGEEGAKPDWLPDEFWDEEGKTAKVEDIVNKYRASSKEAKRLAAEVKKAGKGGEVPEAYELELPEGVELSEEETGRMKELGLSNEQAQGVIGFVLNSVGPVVTDALKEVENTKLSTLWDMSPKDEVFQSRMKTLSDWAYAQYPPEMVKFMSRSAQGVNQLWDMMQKAEDTPAGGQQEASGQVSGDELLALMKDPRYGEDAAYTRDVERRAGFTG